MDEVTVGLYGENAEVSILLDFTHHGPLASQPLGKTLDNAIKEILADGAHTAGNQRLDYLSACRCSVISRKVQWV